MVTTAAVLLISRRHLDNKIQTGVESLKWSGDTIASFTPKATVWIWSCFHLGVPSGFAFSHKQKKSLSRRPLDGIQEFTACDRRSSVDFYQHEPEPKLHFPVSFGIGGFVYLNE